MKKFLSVLLAVMMVLSSTVSYAAPSLAGTADTAVEVPVYEVPAEPAVEEKAELSAVDTTEYGELVARFTFDNVTVGTNYIDSFHSTSLRDNELADLGGVLGSGTHMRSGVTANIPFIYDGTNGSTERHTSAYGRQDAEGNKYIEFTGTGSATRFAIRDYNGAGFANAGHYILTADVLTPSNTKPITGAEFQGNGGKFKHTEYVDGTVTAGEWSTVVISYDDTHDVVSTETDYTSSQNTMANYIYLLTSLANGEVLGVDNVTLWWVPAEVSFNVTHDVEGVLGDSTVTIGGGIKTIEELEALIDPDDAFANAGYYLAGFRDENGFYTDSILFNESGKSYTAVWDKMNILLGYNFDGTEDLANVSPSGATGNVADGAYVTATTSDQGSYRVNISNTSINVADIGDIVYRMKSTGTGAFTTVYFVYVENNTTKTKDWSYTVPSEYTTISTTDLWGLPSVWMDSSVKTLTSFRVQGSAKTGAVVHYDYIYVLGKDKDAGDNVLIDMSNPEGDFNNFKIVFDSTTTAQNIIDEIEAGASDYHGTYYVKGIKAPDGTILKGNTLIDAYVDDEDTLSVVWDKMNILEYGFEFDTEEDYTAMASRNGLRTNIASNAFLNSSSPTADNFKSALTWNEQGGYVTINVAASDAAKSGATANGKKYSFVHDHGFYIPSLREGDLGVTVPAGSFEKLELRVRYHINIDEADYSSNISYWNANKNDTETFNAADFYAPSYLYLKIGGAGWSNYGTKFTKRSVSTIQDQWITITLNASDYGFDTKTLDALRYDYNLPDGSTIDIDYIRFVAEPLPNVFVDMGGKTEDVSVKYDAKTTVADVVSKIDYESEEIVVGLSRTEGGAALPETELIGTSGEDVTLYAVWGDNPLVGEYGELIFNIDFDSASEGVYTYIKNGGTNNSLSDFGGTTNNKFNSENLYLLQFGNGTDNSTYTIVKENNGNKYLEIDMSCDPLYNSPTYGIRHKGADVGYTDVSGYENGYLIVTYDVLADSANPDSSAFKVVFNGENLIARELAGTACTYPQKGAWGTVVSTFGKEQIANDAKKLFTDIADVTRIILQKQNAATTSGVYGLDNISLWYVPETVNVTVVPGDNSYTTEQTFSVNPATETVSDLIEKVNTGNADVALAGLSLTEGGELLASDSLLSFVYDKTLYPKWSMPAKVTVDMGDNTSVAPVIMTYKGSNTIGDVVDKIVDCGDKYFVGLSRTAGGAVLSESELIGSDSEDVTLYAIWEDYEYLEGYGYEFDILPYTSSVIANNATKTLSIQDGYLTVGLAAPSGYTGTYDTQIYLPLTTNYSHNPEKYVPAGVVTKVAARVRFRGIGSVSQNLTTSNSTHPTATFNPAKPEQTYIHWGAPGNTWGTNLKTYSYDYSSTFLPAGIVDGQWYTFFFDTTSGDLNLYNNGVGYLRFDFPRYMPDGTKIDVDFIRLVGDNDLLPAYDGVSEYGEKVWELNFDEIATGTQTFSSKPLHDVGAEFNPKFNAANYAGKTVFSTINTTNEIVAHSDGSGNYLRYTATADGTGSYIFVKNSENQPFVFEDGYFIITYDVINETGAAVPHTLRINSKDLVQDKADNIQFLENGDWQTAVTYYDKEIGSTTTDSDGIITSTSDITLISWYNTSSVKTGETICIDNLTLWYVPKTVTVAIDNSAIDGEVTIVEDYPTCGMTNEELAALLPTVENAKFGGLSATEGGEVLYENRVTTDSLLYSTWAVDTVLTVDNGDNTKATTVTMSIPAGSSVKVSDIEAKFIDHGDKIFKGLATTAGGDKLAAGTVISANESGAVTLYALWEDYNVNGLYSVEFDHKNQGVVMDSSYLSSGKNSAHRSDAMDANGNAAPGNLVDALVWNEEEGYLTFNFTASEYAKAEANNYSNGMKAAVYDAFFQLDSLFSEESHIPAGTVDKIAIRMRYRNMPETAESLWYYRKEKVNDVEVDKYTVDYNPESVKPYFFFTSDSVAAFGSKDVSFPVNLASGSAYRDNWFTVYIDVNTTNFNMDEDALKSIRFDFADIMPDGAAVDIDFVRFLSIEEGYEAPLSREDKTTVRIKSSDAERNGIRVLGQIGNNLREDSVELGWMFSASSRWATSSGSTERSWYELTMDVYNDSTVNKSSLILAGFTKLGSELQIRDYYYHDDYLTDFTAVLYNIPVRNYKSPFIVRPFVKANGCYAYGEPFEINFLDILEAAASSENATDDVIDYYDACQASYAKHLEDLAIYDSDATNAKLATLMSSRSTVISNLIIPTNDVAPVVNGKIANIRVWKNGAFETIQVAVENAYPALLTADNMLTEDYAEKPCIFYEENGVYYIKSLGRATDAGGNYVGIEKSNASAMEANVDGNALFLSEINNVASPFQRLPVDDELTNGKDSFFLGDFATGEFDFTFQRNNSATRTISTGKTGIIGSDSKVVAKYNFPNGTTEWVSFSQEQLLKMGLDSNSNQIADGIDFTNLTYVVSNNTTSVASGTVNKREYEDLAVLAGVVDVPTTVNYTTTNFLAAKYNKVIVKTTSAASYVTIKFTRADGVSDSIKYYAYGTTTDGYRLFDVDLYGMAKYHSTIKSLTVTANSGSVSYAYLVEDPEYYSSADLANMNKTMIFQDMNYDNGFYVRDLDQKLAKSEWTTFANNDATPLWMIDPWYAYDYSDSANKASYELYNIASPTGTSLADSQGTKVVKFNGTKTSTYADGSSHTGDVLSLTLNGRAIYDGKTHSQMQSAGMTYWPHLLIEQSREVYPVDAERNSAGADKIFLEMDIKMTNYTTKVDGLTANVDPKNLSFLLYSYLRPKANPNDRIWFGAQLLTEADPNYPTWNRDTGASAYIYCIPQEVVFQGIKNSFYQTVKDNAPGEVFWGSGTKTTSKDWVHVSLDVTPYIDIAIDWANREDAFGLGALTRDDFYFDGVNIGFETHGNIDGTFEIANFNFVAYNEK